MSAIENCRTAALGGHVARCENCPHTQIKIQTDFAKTAYEGFVAQATKIGTLYSDLAKDSFKPFAEAFAKTPTSK